MIVTYTDKFIFSKIEAKKLVYLGTGEETFSIFEGARAFAYRGPWKVTHHGSVEIPPSTEFSGSKATKTVFEEYTETVFDSPGADYWMRADANYICRYPVTQEPLSLESEVACLVIKDIGYRVDIIDPINGCTIPKGCWVITAFLPCIEMTTNTELEVGIFNYTTEERIIQPHSGNNRIIKICTITE